MAVPRNRTSNAKKGSRRSHHAWKAQRYVWCQACHKAILPHVTCPCQDKKQNSAQ